MEATNVKHPVVTNVFPERPYGFRMQANIIVVVAFGIMQIIGEFFVEPFPIVSFYR